MRFWMAAATVMAVYLLIMTFNPARSSLREGYQCLRRYPALWMVLLFFYLGNALYQTSLQWLEGGAFHWKLQWQPLLPEVVEAGRSASWLPALDQVADLFLLCFPPFPVAALGAFLFTFANWLRLHETLIHHLRKRKRPVEWLLYGLLLLCAMATIAKPLALYAGVSNLRNYLPVLLLIQTSAMVDALAYLFSTLFGVAVQLYFIHCVAVWIRGHVFSHREVMAAALPQAWPVLKWATVIAVLKTGLIVLPRLLCHTPPFHQWLHPEAVESFIRKGSQPVLALLLILTASFQVTLAFQSRTLKGALRDHYRFLRQHRWEALWFFVVAFIHFYAAEVLHHMVSHGLQQSGAVAALWQLAYSAVCAFLGGWLLAAWVCLLRRSAARFEEEDDDPQNLETLRREDWIAPI